MVILPEKWKKAVKTSSALYQSYEAGSRDNLVILDDKVYINDIEAD